MVLLPGADCSQEGIILCSGANSTLFRSTHGTRRYIYGIGTPSSNAKQDAAQAREEIYWACVPSGHHKTPIK